MTRSEPTGVEQRRLIAPLLDENSPADALAAYYALYHDARRTRFTLHRDAQARVDGFLAVCQTGLDLFRPLAVLHAPGGDAARALLRSGLDAGRPAFLITALALAEFVGSTLPASDGGLFRVYALEPAGFQPIVNVLVQQESSAGGLPHWLIRSAGGETAAIAGINWRSPRWAEVYVQVDARARGRGLGRSVVSACTRWLFDQGLRPLYLVAEDNAHSIALAEALGYRDTRERMYMAQVTGVNGAPAR